MSDDLAPFPTPQEAFGPRRPAHTSAAFDLPTNVPPPPSQHRQRQQGDTSHHSGYHGPPLGNEAMTMAGKTHSGGYHVTHNGHAAGSNHRPLRTDGRQDMRPAPRQNSPRPDPMRSEGSRVASASSVNSNGSGRRVYSGPQTNPQMAPQGPPPSNSMRPVHQNNPQYHQMYASQAPIQSQSMQSQAIQHQSMQHQPMQHQPMHNQPMQHQPIQSPSSYQGPMQQGPMQQGPAVQQMYSQSPHTYNKIPRRPVGSSNEPMTGGSPRLGNQLGDLSAAPIHSVNSSEPRTAPDLRSLFDEVDRHKHGYLTERELSKALVNGDYTLFDAHTVRLMMKMFDQDGDGAIYFAEFGQLWKYLHDWRQVFERFDTSDNDSISLDEFVRALAAFGYNLSTSCLLFMFNAGSKLNRQGQREMSFDMFVQSCISIKSITDTFKKYDTDRDGYVTMGFEDFLIETTKLH